MLKLERVAHPSWPEEREALLRQLWSDGLSASQIARCLSTVTHRLGTVTRNAVIGKVNRLGLSGRATTSSRKAKSRRAPDRKPKQPKARKSAWQRHLESQPVNVEPIVDAPIPLHQRRTVDTLEAHDCRWPIGDPQEADFHFCGAKKLPGLPYCECHARRAFQPVTGRSHSASLRYSTMAGGFVGVSVRKLEDA